MAPFFGSAEKKFLSVTCCHCGMPITVKFNENGRKNRKIWDLSVAIRCILEGTLVFGLVGFASGE